MKKVGDVTVNDGKGLLTVSGLPKGEYTVSVLYEGNEKYPFQQTSGFLKNRWRNL